jgi:nucleotide-binding universal stress UspA family protein
MFSTIVVGTNGTSTAKGAVAAAASLAKTHDSTVHLVWAFKPVAAMAMTDPTAMAVAPSDAEMQAQVAGLLDDLVEQLGRDGVKAQAHAVGQAAANAIIEVATREEADLIIVGNKGMKGARRALGSVPNTVAHHACCAVLIVPTAG